MVPNMLDKCSFIHLKLQWQNLRTVSIKRYTLGIKYRVICQARKIKIKPVFGGIQCLLNPQISPSQSSSMVLYAPKVSCTHGVPVTSFACIIKIITSIMYTEVEVQTS